MAYFAYCKVHAYISRNVHHHNQGSSFEIDKRDSTDQLVGDITVIFSSQLVTNRTLHQSRQGREDVDRWVDLSVVQLTVHKDLSLGDVPRQIWDRVRDIYDIITRSEQTEHEKDQHEGSKRTIVRHSENRNLRDGSIAALYTTCAFVYGRQVSVHVTRVSTTTRDFFASCRHLFCTSTNQWVCARASVGSRVEEAGFTSRRASAYDDMSVRMTRTCFSS